MDPKERRQLNRRSLGVVAVLVAVAAVFVWDLYRLQVVEGADYLAQSARKIAQVETVEAARGDILDRNGQTLVTSRTSYQVTLIRNKLGEDRDNVLLALMRVCREEGVAWNDSLPVSKEAPYTYTVDTASATDQSRWSNLKELMGWDDSAGAEDLLRQMAESFQIDTGAYTIQEIRYLDGVLYELWLRYKEITWTTYYFAEDVNVSFIARVKDLGLPGVNIGTSSAREYETSYAAHVLGRVSKIPEGDLTYYESLGYSMDESVGWSGVEKAFEEYLHGTRGQQTVETNDQGKVVSSAYTQEPEPGDNVVLTLDAGLQQVVEDSLAETVPTLTEDVQGAAAVVLSVKDGSVLALASYPTFDLANFSADYSELAQDSLKPIYDRAIQGTYPPGSTFKMVTAVAGLQEGIIDTESEIECTGKYTYYNDYQPECWIYRQYGRTHGWEDVTGAITDSCNIFFFDVGRRLGIDRLVQYAHSFGLGESTGIELEENTGAVGCPDYSQSVGLTWYEGNTLQVAIGQENSRFTPLQLANYAATLANGGTRWKVHLLKAVKSNDYSQVLYEYQPEVAEKINIDPENLAAVKAGMLGLTTTGSVTSYFKDLAEQGIQVAAKTGSAQVTGSEESNAVFVCFAPFDDPQIAMAIVAEKGGSGSELGAIAAKILQYYFTEGNDASPLSGENALIQ